MFSSLIDFPYLKFLLFAWLIFVILSLALKAIFKIEVFKASFLLIGLGLICLGFATGVIMGNNRNPISETVMTSVFALLGGTITYIFFQKEDANKDKPRVAFLQSVKMSNENRAIMSMFLILFPMALLYGGHLGSTFRVKNEEIERIYGYNNKLKLDSVDIWKKEQENRIEIDKIKQQSYYQKVYETWSENEKKRYEQKLKFLKVNDSIPDFPDYFDTCK